MTKRPYEKSVAPLPPAPEPSTVWSLAIVPMKRMGVTEYNIVAIQTRGDRVLSQHVIPESNYERLEGALQDFRRCATQAYRFGAMERLIAGRV